ncbi:hypothetical protein GCM10027047_26130 [Rhodococcus aerolatus]
MTGTAGTAGVVALYTVILARFLVPLAIPRFPVPGLLAALVLDAVDQTVFQQFPGLDIAGYQQYDKALDIYYLTIAYASTLRNWTDPFAFQVSRFLFYYRLVGTLVFELADQQWLLLVFPNTFEYFFLAYELVRTRWAPVRLGHRALLGLAAGIWVVVKLPQEWWLHVAELDVTDEVKTRVMGVAVDDGWGAAVANRPWVLVVAAAVAAALWLGWRRGVAPRLPAEDWPFGFDVDERARGGEIRTVPASVRARQSAFLRGPLLEKIVLVSIVSVVFAQIVPGVRATNTQVVATVAVVVVLNSVASHWVAGQGAQWRSTVAQFLGVLVINAGIVLALVVLPTPGGARVDVVSALFFLLLLSLLVTLYDRYRMLRLLRRRRGRLPLQWRRAHARLRDRVGG